MNYIFEISDHLYSNNNKFLKFWTAIIILNSGVINYSTFFLGLLPFHYSVHFALVIPLIILFSKSNIVRKGTDNTNSLGYSLLVISLFLFFIFIKDLSIVGSQYNNYPLPTLFNQALCYFFIFNLTRCNIDSMLDLVYKMQIVLFVISIFTILQYIFPELFIYSESIFENITVDYTSSFTRYQHVAYHFAMLSIFLFLFYQNYSHLFSVKKKLFFYFNFIIQLVNLFTANYRSSIIAVAILIMTAFFMNFLFLKNFLQKFFAAIIVIIVILISVNFYIYQILNFPVLSRILNTNSIFNDPNILWRIVESEIALQNMNTFLSYIWGVGYINPFSYFNLQVVFLHNGFISIFYNFGIIGSILFSILIFFILKQIFQNYFYHNKYLFSIFSIYFFTLLLQNFSSGIFNREESAILAFGTFVFFLINPIHLSQVND